MGVMDQKYYKLGRNIEGLRNAFGLSREDLAGHINVSYQSIAAYESGERTPSKDVLITLAQFFRITESQLLHEDFSNFKKITDAPLLNKEYQANQMDRLFPIVQSAEALSNTNFNEAYSLHVKLINDLKKQLKDVDTSSMEKFYSLYESAEKEGVIEASANLLSFCFLCGFLISFANEETIKYTEKLIAGKIDIKEYLAEAYLQKYDKEKKILKEAENSKNEFVKENGAKILFRIWRLKKSSQYSELGDFFLTRMYQLGLSPTPLTAEMSAEIGSELQLVFSIIGNPYFDENSTPCGGQTE